MTQYEVALWLDSDILTVRSLQPLLDLASRDYWTHFELVFGIFHNQSILFFVKLLGLHISIFDLGS